MFARVAAAKLFYRKFQRASAKKTLQDRFIFGNKVGKLWFSFRFLYRIAKICFPRSVGGSTALCIRFPEAFTDLYRNSLQSWSRNLPVEETPGDTFICGEYRIPVWWYQITGQALDCFSVFYAISSRSRFSRTIWFGIFGKLLLSMNKFVLVFLWLRRFNLILAPIFSWFCVLSSSCKKAKSSLSLRQPLLAWSSLIQFELQITSLGILAFIFHCFTAFPPSPHWNSKWFSVIFVSLWSLYFRCFDSAKQTIQPTFYFLVGSFVSQSRWTGWYPGWLNLSFISLLVT